MEFAHGSIISLLNPISIPILFEMRKISLLLNVIFVLCFSFLANAQNERSQTSLPVYSGTPDPGIGSSPALAAGHRELAVKNSYKQARLKQGDVFEKITNPAGNHYEGGVNDPVDGFADLYLKPEYAGKMKEVVYHVFRQTDRPDLNPHITVTGTGTPFRIPGLRYSTYALLELHLNDGRIIPMDSTEPIYIYSAGRYAQPRGHLQDYTRHMAGPNVARFINSFNQQAGSSQPIVMGLGGPTPLGCNDGQWLVTWSSQGSSGGPIIVAENSCGQKFVFHCIQHNGPGFTAGMLVNGNGGDPCTGTLILTANIPSQTYQALPININIDLSATCLSRNATTGTNGSTTMTASWEYISAGWGNGTLASSIMPVTYSWSSGGTSSIKTVTDTGTYTVTLGFGPCTFSKSIRIGRNGYAGQNASTSVCANSGIISLAGILTNEDVNGTWTRTSGSGGTFNASAGTFNPSGSTSPSVFTYTVPGTNGCTAANATVTVNTVLLPDAGADSSTTVCATSAATISLADLVTGEQPGGTWTRTSGTGGTFNASAGTFIPTGATTSAFNYTVSGTAPCSTSDVSKATVNVIPALNAGTSGDTTVCATSTAVINLANLISNENTGGTWTNMSGTGGTFNAAAGTFQPAGNGTAATRKFLYTVSNSCGTDTSIATITLIPCCSLSVSAASTVITCAAPASAVSAVASNGSGNYTYSWTGPNSFTSTSASFSTTVAGAYAVTVTDTTTHCTASSNTQVTSTVNVPVVTLTGNTAICSNSPVTFTAAVQSGTGVAPFTYVFTGNTGAVLQSGTSNTLTITPAGITAVSVKVTGANTCEATQTKTVNSPGPTLTLTNIISICAGQSTVVTADNGGLGGYTYLWLDNSSSNPVRTVAPVVTTNYTVVRTTAQGCKDTATSTVQTFQKPVIVSIASTAPGCTTATGSITVNATGNPAQLRYRLNSGVWQSSNTFSNLAAGNYTVSVGNTNGTCQDTTTPPVTLAPLNTISSGIAGPSGMCALENGLFQANPGVSGATYSWSATGNPAITGGSTNSTFFAQWAANQAGSTQTVTLTVSLNGCSKDYTKAVVVNTAVFAAAGPDKAICPQAQVSIGLAPAQAGPAGASFSWSPSQYILGSSTTSSVLVAPPVTTNFILTVTDPINGCTRKDTVTVVVDVAVNPVADAGPDQSLPVSSTPSAVTLGGPLTTQPGAEPNTTIGYLWTAVNGSPVSALSATNIANPVFTRPSGVTTSTVYTYVFMVQKQYTGASTLQGVTCPVYDTVKITFANLPTAVRLSPKVLLQGALYNTNPLSYVSDSVMRDNLRSQSKVPFISPYPALTNPITGTNVFVPVNNILAEEIGLTVNGQYPPTLILGLTGNNAIVDWVFLELRSASNLQQVVATRSALLQRDGDVVDMDGFSPVVFDNITDLSCHLVIRHRNHLGVMTKNPLQLSATTQVVDFTHTPAKGGVETYGNNAQKVLTNDHLALWAGNVNADRFIIFSGSNNELNALQYIIYNAPGNPTQNPSFILSEYSLGDVDMKGTAIYQGTGNDPNYISENVFNHPANPNHNQTYIIFEQVPPRSN